MDKLPKVGLPILILVVILIIIIAKSTVTIDSGEAGVLYKTFDKELLQINHHLVKDFMLLLLGIKYLYMK